MYSPPLEFEHAVFFKKRTIAQNGEMGRELAQVFQIVKKLKSSHFRRGKIGVGEVSETAGGEHTEKPGQQGIASEVVWK